MQVGSISLAAEIAIAGLTPVFLLEYSGVADPAEVLKHADLKNNPDPTALIPPGAGGVSLSQISLLATIPLLSNGFATYLLVPLSTAIGRRPVLILTSTLAWTSGFWAGASTSLYSHIGARVFHGLGSGAVEALIPLIIQDLVFIHQRNKAIASIFAAQVRTRTPQPAPQLVNHDAVCFQSPEEPSLCLLNAKRAAGPITFGPFYTPRLFCYPSLPI